MEICETHRFIMQAIEVGRLEDGVAGARQIAITLVVAKDEDDVGP